MNTSQRSELLRMARATLEGALLARPGIWISHGELARTMAAIVAGEERDIKQAIFDVMEEFGRNRTTVVVEEDVRYTGDEPQFAIAMCWLRSQRKDRQ